MPNQDTDRIAGYGMKDISLKCVACSGAVQVSNRVEAISASAPSQTNNGISWFAFMMSVAAKQLGK